MQLLVILSAIVCFGIIISTAWLLYGIGKIGNLSQSRAVPQSGKHKTPLVSIIIPACNEEENIENSLRSLVTQEYENIEIIVVNDRSTDNTSKILNRLVEQFTQLRVFHNDRLPKGWMGKSHALHLGASEAQGDYLLFTDADVVLEKSTLQRAVNHMSANGLDHLTCLFRNTTPGWLLNSLILDSSLGLLMAFRPWLLKNQDQNGGCAFAGIGAFNLMKKDAYLGVGGHLSIRMHPVDDMMLGKILMENGYRQDCLLAYDFVKIPWYDSIGAMVAGLQKNMFAVLHYRLVLVPIVLVGICLTYILPFWGAILADGYLQLFCCLGIAGRMVAFCRGLRLIGSGWWYLPACLITPYISCYIIVNSAYLTVKNQGIRWRGHLYELNRLKKTRPLLF